MLYENLFKNVIVLLFGLDMKKEWMITASIPVIFAIGIIAFFTLIPAESWTADNFIGYVSGLSTAIMVLVYILTTSRQLTTMNNQLKEMQFSRTLQTQPLPLLTCQDAKIEKPRFYTSPRIEFSKLSMGYRILFEAEIENVGNGPAVTIDILPRIVCIEWSKGPSEFKPLCLALKEAPKKHETVESVMERVAFLSLKEGASQKIHCLFPDRKSVLIKNILSPKYTTNYLDLTLLYKNVLGASFRTKMAYEIEYSDEDLDKIKSYMRAIETSKIDFAEELEEYENAMRQEDPEKAYTLSDKLHRKFIKKHKFEEIPLQLKLISEDFSVSPITEEQYRKEVERVKEFLKKEFPDV